MVLRDKFGRFEKGIWKKRTYKVCPICKNEFTNSPHEIKNQVYCSKSCSRINKILPKKGVYNYCSVCNNKFYTYPYRIGIARFCSIRCSKIGITPWNKETKGICKPNKTSFKKGSNGFIGEHSYNTKKKISSTKQDISLEDWKGFSSFEPYDEKFNERFKRAIRKRDNQICMFCGIHREKLKKALSVHHINYNKKLSIPENCISLCYDCHLKTNINRKHWISFFQSLLSEKYGYEYQNNQPIIKLEINKNEN